MKKDEILHRLYQEDIMRKIHDDVKAGLVGILQREYLQTFPLDRDIQTPMVHRAVIDMLTANLVHHYAKDIIDRVVEIIDDPPYDKDTK